MNGDANYLIEKHRGRGAFLDANLLVLLLVGQVNPLRIRQFKRTQNFDENEFYLLQLLVEFFGEPLVATPHILSQVSDLTDLPGAERQLIRQRFKIMVEIIEERYIALPNNL